MEAGGFDPPQKGIFVNLLFSSKYGLIPFSIAI